MKFPTRALDLAEYSIGRSSKRQLIGSVHAFGSADQYLNSYAKNFDHLQTNQSKQKLWRPLGLSEDGKPQLYLKSWNLV